MRRLHNVLMQYVSPLAALQLHNLFLFSFFWLDMSKAYTWDQIRSHVRLFKTSSTFNYLFPRGFAVVKDFCFHPTLERLFFLSNGSDHYISPYLTLYQVDYGPSYNNKQQLACCKFTLIKHFENKAMPTSIIKSNRNECPA